LLLLLFFHLNWNGESKKECTQKDTMAVWWQCTSKEMKNKCGHLENDPFFDWQPVMYFAQWSNVFMSALAKNNFRYVVLNCLQPQHLITYGYCFLLVVAD